MENVVTTQTIADPGHLSIRIKHIVVGQLTAVVTAPKSRSSAGWFSLQFEIEETGSKLVKVVLKKTCLSGLKNCGISCGSVIKIHKPGKSVRPIVSAIGSPTYLLSKWLTKEFENLPIAQSSFSVKNSNEFIKKLNNIQLQDGEILISFDVCSLFPSVPIPQILDYLRNLLELNNFSQEVVNEYINLTKLCMKQNCFQFNNSFFEQHEGTAMGNSLSPFIANLFMSRFETDIKEEFEYFPRIWIRYVDDIFAVFDTKVESVDSFISKLNSRFTSVNFTYEIENNGQLPFLDVLVIKNNQNNLEFDIYRKDTSTLRYIPNDSHHCYQHKMASLNFLVHRLLSFPLSKERFEKREKID
ncbi:hypothetical protein NQ317_016249 [Molorchus minor]|uniref:Reverse transcriptase domain-containing protein n=1 Tax=Molorchus minor TaxID=1323400 RepID=A0ABQ9K0V6_9CUCU|nr:hypothetical protein NQ317_016249 [Molorchus minor]